MVILDPPAFAKRESEMARALEAYYRLTALGLGVLQKRWNSCIGIMFQQSVGGQIFSRSCTELQLMRSGR